MQNTAAQDLTSFAISVEENGAAFYRAAAERSPNPETAQVFRRLAEDEDEHARHFRQLRQSGPPPLSPEVARYLTALLQAPESLFLSLAEAATAGDARAALALAIQAEKDSILLYQELYEVTKDEAERKHLANLLRAEKLHLLELQDLLNGEG
ncbi:MAG: ferritin-like domain-containing protein [Chitinophagales bacterium]